MRRTVAIILSVVFFVVTSSPSWSQGEFELEYQRFDDVLHPLASMCHQPLGKTSTKALPPERLPDTFSRRAPRDVFVSIVASKEIYLVVDSTKDVPELYADTDLDRDLSDEKPYVGTPHKRGGHVFGPIQFSAGPAGKLVNLPVWIGGNRRDVICPAGFRSAEVRLGEASYPIALVDANFDGNYDGFFDLHSPMGLRSQFDFFAIDLNGDGRFRSSSRPSSSFLFPDCFASKATITLSNLSLMGQRYGFRRPR